MKTKKEKKGFFERFMEKKGKAEKGSSCCSCCNFQIEEIPDKDEDSEKPEPKEN